MLKNKPNQRVVVAPAWYDSGFYAMKMAKALGAYVVASAPDESISFLLNGADVSMDFSRASNVEGLKEILGLKECGEIKSLEQLEEIGDVKFIDIILHVEGTLDMNHYARFMKDSTVIVSISEEELEMPEVHRKRVERFVFEPNGTDLFEITKMINQGVLSVYPPLTYSFREVHLALTKMKENYAKHDKFVLKVDIPISGKDEEDRFDVFMYYRDSTSSSGDYRGDDDF